MNSILIIDDNQESREFLIACLKHLNCTLLEASNGEEALSIIEKRVLKLDLIITDIQMPKLNGIELVARLNKDVILCKIPVIFYTSENHIVDATLVPMGCGIPTVLIKPCDPELIIEAVQKVLTLHAKSPLAANFHKAPNNLIVYASEISQIDKAIVEIQNRTDELAIKHEELRIMLKVLVKPKAHP